MPRGNFDDIIAELLEREARHSPYNKLKREERSMEPGRPKEQLERDMSRPPVEMEPGMTPEDYPPSDEYTYIAPPRPDQELEDMTEEDFKAPPTREDYEFMKKMLEDYKRMVMPTPQKMLRGMDRLAGRQEERENVNQVPREWEI